MRDILSHKESLSHSSGSLLKDVVKNVETLCLKLWLFQSWNISVYYEFNFSPLLHTGDLGDCFLHCQETALTHGRVWTANQQ